MFVIDIYVDIDIDIDINLYFDIDTDIDATPFIWSKTLDEWQIFQLDPVLKTRFLLNIVADSLF